MCVLKGFSWLVMCSDVRDRFISESFSFRYDCVKKCYFCLRDFSHEFDCRVEVVSLCYEQVYFLYVGIPQ